MPATRDFTREEISISDPEGDVRPILSGPSQSQPRGKVVYIHLYTQSEPIILEHVRNTYTKGPLFCVMLDALFHQQEVHKFPLEHIFRIKEFEQ